MKRILVIDTAASSGGALTVLKDFYKCATRYCDIEWIFLISGPYVKEKENIKVIVESNLKSRINRLLFENITGRFFIKKINPNVVFSLQSTAVRGLVIPQVLYVHQSVPFQDIYKFSFFKRKEFYMAVIQYIIGSIIKSSIKFADIVIVQTFWMKQAILKQCLIDEKKIMQVYPSVIDVDRKCTYIQTSKFFYPTSDAFYKNIGLLLKACKELDKENVSYSLRLTADGENTDRIHFVGRISRKEVYDNYVNACLVFPSYIETFGYPLVEAKSLGLIILASDCAFSHELLDGYQNAYFFNPFDHHELFCLMKQVAIGEIKRQASTVENIDNNNVEDSWDEVVRILKNVNSNE